MRWPWQEPKQEPDILLEEKVVEGKALVPQKKVGEAPADMVPSEIGTLPREEAEKKTHKLSYIQQRAMVQLIGEFRTRREILAMMKQHFNVALDQTSIDYYLGSPKWRPFIEEARQLYRSKVDQVPIANRMVRMEQLERLYRQHLASGRKSEAASVLRQAKEEMDSHEKKGGSGDTYIYHDQRVAYLNSKEQVDKYRAWVQQHTEGADAISEA